MKKFLGQGIINLSLHDTTISYRVSKNEKTYGFNEDNKNPHYDLWFKINNYFRRRGFLVSKDPYFEKEYKLISKDRRYGIKNFLEYKSDRHCSGFKFEFFQNVNYENSNGGYYDFNKYNKMPYMIKLSYRNEILRLAKYLESINIPFIIEKKLSDIENIIDNNNQNLHVHGPISCLEDIQKSLTGYDLNSNSNDKNNKKIIGGDMKCFYDYRKKIAIGKAYHNINNMWWVIINGVSHNVSSSSLFDLYPGVPKKKPITSDEQIQRLHSELRQAEISQNYERCIVLRELLKKEKLFYVFSIKHDCWWMGNNNGYTKDKLQAGVYTEVNILSNPSYYNNGETTIAFLKN